MSTVKQIVHKVLTIGVAVVTVLASFAGLTAPMAALAVDASCPAGVVPGASIKVTTPTIKPAVYALDNSLHWRYYESGDLLKSWTDGSSYGTIVSISQKCFDSLMSVSQGPFNVQWRPGSYVVKYLGSDQLFHVGPNGVLYPLTSAAATALYGAGYKVQTIGLSEYAFYGNPSNGKSGASLDGTKAAPGMLVKVDGKTYYVVDMNTIREVTGAGMTGNMFASQFVHTLPASAIAGFSTGNQISGMEAALADRLQQGGVVSTPVVGGNLTVSLAADNPAGNILASGTAFNPVLKVNLTAGAQAVSVTGLTLTKSGYVASNRVSGVEVIDAQGMRHGNIASSITSDNYVTILFAANPINVAAGSTQTVTVRVNLASTATAGTLQLSLANASAITSNGSVGGSFPVTGNVFTMQDGTNSIAAVTVDAQSVGSNMSLNADAVNEQDIAKFSVQETSSREDIRLSKLTLYNGGTAADTDVKDVQLVAQDGTVLATSQQVSKNVVFDLSAAPYTIAKGMTKTFTVRAKIVDGASRTIQFFIYNDYDVAVMGASTNAGILPSAGANDTNFPIGDATNYNKVTIASGTISFNKDSSSPTNAIAPGSNGVVLAKFYAKPTGENMELRKISIAIRSSTPVLTGSYTIKVNGSSVYSGSVGEIAAYTATASTTITLSSYPVLTSGQNNYITVEANVLSNASNSATTSIFVNLVQAKRLITNDLYTFTTNQAQGNILSIQGGALKVTNLATPVSQSLVAGSSNVELANLELSGSAVSSGEDVRVTSIIVNQTGTGTVTDIGNLVMYMKNGDGTLTALSTSGSTATGAASTTFNFSQPIMVPKNGAVTLILKGDVLAGSSGTHIFSVTQTLVSAVGKDTGNTVNPSGTGNGQTMTVTSGGSLTLSLVSGNNGAPSNDQVVAVGTADVSVFAFKLTAQNEPIKLTSLKLYASGTLVTVNNLKDLKLYKDSDTQPFLTANQMVSSSVDTTTSTSYTWTAVDNLLPAPIQPGTSVTIYVKASIGPVGQAVLGNSFRFHIFSATDVGARGVSSGASITPSGTPTVNAVTYIVPFTVKVEGDAPAAGSSQSQTISNGTQLARVKVTNMGNAKVTITGIKFTDSGSHSSNTTTYRLYYSDQNSANYTQNTASTTMGSVNWNASGARLSDVGTTFTIDGGAYRYITVAINTLGGTDINGAFWQLSVASIGDVTYSIAESDYGYDGNNDGAISGSVTGLYADGKPTMGTLVKNG